jgi:hypothetical protein
LSRSFRVFGVLLPELPSLKARLARRDGRLKAEFSIRESARAGGEELKEAFSDASDPDLWRADKTLARKSAFS